MPVIGKIAAPGGKYQGDDGQEKTRWIHCGVLIRTADGKMRLKLDAIPMNPEPNQDGKPGLWFAVFDPQQTDRQAATPPAPTPAPVTKDKDPDIPF